MFVSFIGCKTQSKKVLQGSDLDTTKPPKGVIYLRGSEDCDFHPSDTSIYGINLHDRVSALHILGPNYKLLENDSQEQPYISFLNSSATEQVFLIAHYASTKYEFDEFEVKQVDTIIKNIPKLKIDHFVTGMGITIGMTKKDITSRLGSCYSIIRDHSDREKIYFRIDNPNKSKFLKRYNMPVFYASYYFKDEKLKSFKFGFEYP